MTHRESQDHLNAEQLQAFLDGEVPSRDIVGLEEHLAACTRCSTEMETWRELFAEIGSLPALAPHEGFTARVMARVDVPEPASVAVRVWRRAAALFGPSASPRHLSVERLQDYLDGSLSNRQTARVKDHLDTCGDCADLRAGWTSVFEQLEGLGHFAPERHFAHNVMAGVQLPVPGRAPARSPLAHRALAWARRLAPQTRKAWAALSGIAVTPAVTAGLLLYAVFSHPTLTPGALVSYVWWQVTDVAAAGWGSLAAYVSDTTQLFGIFSMAEAFAAAPLALAGGALVYSIVSAFAVRVLYRNLFTAPSVDGGYA